MEKDPNLEEEKIRLPDEFNKALNVKMEEIYHIYEIIVNMYQKELSYTSTPDITVLLRIYKQMHPSYKFGAMIMRQTVLFLFQQFGPNPSNPNPFQNFEEYKNFIINKTTFHEISKQEIDDLKPNFQMEEIHGAIIGTLNTPDNVHKAKVRHYVPSDKPNTATPPPPKINKKTSR